MDRALNDGRALLTHLETLGVKWICTSAGSPYYNPHIQRPAFFPPLDGYEPPEDPLRGVARQIDATAKLKAEFPNLVFVGSAYSYLQEWLPNVGQYNVRNGLTDFVGLGRVALSYPDLPADVLSGKAAAARGHLPHVQRLHDRSAHGDGVGLLSARSVLRSAARSRAHSHGARHFAGLNAARLLRSQAASRPAWQLKHAFGLSVLPKRSVISASGMSSISCDRA